MSVRQQPPPKRIQTPTKEPLAFLHRTLVVQPIAVKLRDPRRRHHHPFGEAVVQYIQREQKGIAEGGGQAVIGGGFEGEEVDAGGGLRAVVVDRESVFIVFQE